MNLKLNRNISIGVGFILTTSLLVITMQNCSKHNFSSTDPGPSRSPDGTQEFIQGTRPLKVSKTLSEQNSQWEVDLIPSRHPVVPKIIFPIIPECNVVWSRCEAIGFLRDSEVLNLSAYHCEALIGLGQKVINPTTLQEIQPDANLVEASKKCTNRPGVENPNWFEELEPPPGLLGDIPL